MSVQSIPDVTLNSGNAKSIPVLGPGRGSSPFLAPEAVLEAIGLGYRILATKSSSPLSSGTLITMVICPALRKTLQIIKLEYRDQYLVHFPASLKAGVSFSTILEDVVSNGHENCSGSHGRVTNTCPYKIDWCQ
ncbi:hypothetical protein POM88_028177 [Heracleum sosnowskyi]|uniref:Uncharacterized protein n=1 Tax=Heracleum sosnowskyi TaxID=360622 RepID=A0AAD8IBL7_9APIA|nr:hypothetical protein POM88_028177 [Heracleum sosnowskyi]